MAIDSQSITEALEAWAADRDVAHMYGPRPEGVDWSKEPEYATDKDRVKVVPCTISGCARPMVVSTFYVPAWAKCRVCAGESNGSGEKASVAVPQAGRTDPAVAVDLSACLVNDVFAEMNCLMCGEPMELKSVNHNSAHGPFHYERDASGRRIKKQDAIGETVMFQCNHCRLVTTHSTTAETVFTRQNEVRPGKDANIWAHVNGEREEGTT